jgi:dimethylhistidine N-methyltransferase
VKRDSTAFDRRIETVEHERIGQVLAGLRETPKRIDPIWFYDARGSVLFERISATPEYYLTRTEIGLMRTHVREMAAALGPRLVLIEPGSGASLKTRLLLEALDAPAAYVPVDISCGPLHAAARRLRDDFPALNVQPLCTDFTRPIAMPEAALHGARRRAVYFPGSTIGNFAPEAAVELLARLRELAGPEGAILLGVDRVKPASVLEPAYDDVAGITAEFNRNMLRHLNRALGATFEPGAFAHCAPWVPDYARIEMRLVANSDLAFTVGGERFAMKHDEYLLTEYSHKYTLRAAAELAGRAGLTLRRAWSDARDWFSVLLLEPA